LARQVDPEAALLATVVAPFEPLIPGIGGGVLLGKKEKLANSICPGYGVLGYCGGRVSRDCSGQACDPAGGGALGFEAMLCPSCPYTIPVNPSDARMARATCHKKDSHRRK